MAQSRQLEVLAGMTFGYQAVYDHDFLDAIDYAAANRFDYVSFDLNVPRFYIDRLDRAERERIRCASSGPAWAWLFTSLATTSACSPTTQPSEGESSSTSARSSSPPSTSPRTTWSFIRESTRRSSRRTRRKTTLPASTTTTSARFSTRTC